MPLISFKIAKDLHKALTELGKKETDDAGNELTASTMARKIVRQYLEGLKTKK